MNTVASLRPTDNTPAAIRAALANCRTARAAAETEIGALRQKRQEQLLTATNRDILTTENLIRDQERLVDQIDALTPLIEAELPAALGRVMQRDIKAKAQLALEAAEVFDAWAKKNYARLAAELLAGMRLEEHALALKRDADATLRAMVQREELQAAGGIDADLFGRFPKSLGAFRGFVFFLSFAGSESWP